jgi:hypothetical protein
MSLHRRSGVAVLQCSACAGVFLRREDLGMLIERENEWHVTSGPATQPLPRIVPGMSAPTATLPTRDSRSFLDALFG